MKIMIFNYEDSALTIITDENINHHKLENDCDDDIEVYLEDVEGFNMSQCHYMSSDRININIR